MTPTHYHEHSGSHSAASMLVSMRSAHKPAHKAADMHTDIRSEHKPRIDHPVPDRRGPLHHPPIAPSSPETDAMLPEHGATPTVFFASFALFRGHFSPQPSALSLPP